MKFHLVIKSLLVMAVIVSVESGRQRKRRRCRCEKFIQEINDTIDAKLKVFEKKFLENSHTQHPTMNETEKIDDIDKRIGRLDLDVSDTRKTLSKESHALRYVREQMYAQRQTMASLNENFFLLETIVRNLTSVVDRLEGLFGPGNTSDHTVATTMRTTTTVPTTRPNLPQVPMQYPKHCQEVYLKGGMRFPGDYYIMIKPELSSKPFKVMCKMLNNSGWTVVQKRVDGSVDFYRDWAEYKRGFGNLEGEFWLGNDNIFALTNQGDTKLRIEMEEWNGEKHFAEYDFFRIAAESDHYRLNLRNYKGDAGDSLTSYWENHDGMPFSTRDRDNDGRYYDNCAEHYHGAWWFNNCFDSHLNGRYYANGSHQNYFVRNGIQWNTIHLYSSLRQVEMMVKPTDNFKLPNEV